MRVRFADFRFDSERRELTHRSQTVHLSPKALLLLETLLAERPKVIRKKELQSRLWPDVVVDEGNLTNAVSELRTALRDDPKQPRFVRTVHGYGYSFIGETQPDDASGAGAGGSRLVRALGFSVGFVKRPAAPFAASVAALIFLATVFSPRGEPRTGIQMQTLQLSDEGAIRSCALSGDRRFLAYVVFRGTRKELRLKLLPTGADLLLVAAPKECSYLGDPVFAADGNAIYYSERDSQPAPAQHNIDTVRRVSMLGGDARVIAEANDTYDSAFAMSPDGHEIAFASNGQSGVATLYLLGAQGGKKQQVAKVNRPDSFYTLSWSHDGRTLAASNDGSVVTAHSIFTFDVATQKLGWIASGESFKSIRWLPDDRGFVGVTVRGRLAYVTYPEGRLTMLDWSAERFNDVNVVDDTTLVAITDNADWNLWTMPIGGSEATRLSSSVNAPAGLGAWTVTGRIAFTKSEEDRSSIWTCDVDGDNAKQVTHPGAGVYHVQMAVSPDGQTIVFAERDLNSKTRAKWRLVKAAIDGSNPAPLTQWAGFVGRPAFTPDGKFVVYTYDEEQGGKHPRAFGISAGGGTPVMIADDCATNDIDPTGHLLTCCDPKGEEFVVSLDDKHEVWRRALRALYPIRWLDTNHIAFINVENGSGGDVCAQPLNGGPARRLTSLPSHNVTNFAFSPDRRNMAVSLRYLTRTPVLLTNVPLPHAASFTRLVQRAAALGR